VLIVHFVTAAMIGAASALGAWTADCSIWAVLGAFVLGANLGLLASAVIMTALELGGRAGTGRPEEPESLPEQA